MLNSVIYDSRWAAACWLLQSNTELSRCHSHRNAWDHHHPALNYFLLLFLRGGLMRIVNEFGTSKGGNQWQEENDSSIMIAFTIHTHGDGYLNCALLGTFHHHSDRGAANNQHFGSLGHCSVSSIFSVGSSVMTFNKMAWSAAERSSSQSISS